MDSQAPQLTEHIKSEDCLRHADPRDTLVARPELEPCTCECSCGHRLTIHDDYGCTGLYTVYDSPEYTGPEPWRCPCEVAR